MHVKFDAGPWRVQLRCLELATSKLFSGGQGAQCWALLLELQLFGVLSVLGELAHTHGDILSLRLSAPSSKCSVALQLSLRKLAIRKGPLWPQ
jgi:hypothetical protein